VIRTFSGKPDAAIDQQWSVTFVPSGPLQINLPLPSGALAVEGTMNWTRGDESFELTVTTARALHYNAGCTDTVQRIDDGELLATGVFGDIEGNVRVRWTDCGDDPRFTFAAAE
jgi:hypothetical protein